jgi:hypothetical protein
MEMTKTIEYKGRNRKAYVSELLTRDGRQVSHAEVKIGRNTVALVWQNGAWVKG